jgi:hypothetical protein
MRLPSSPIAHAGASRAGNGFLRSFFHRIGLCCGALAAHVVDEASTGFLDSYNPVVTAVGLPTLQFRLPVWITLLVLAIAGLLILSYSVRRGTWWTVYAGHAFRFVDVRQRRRAPEVFDPQARVDVRSLHVAAIVGRVTQSWDRDCAPEFLAPISISSMAEVGQNDVENLREKTAQGIGMHHGRRDSEHQSACCLIQRRERDAVCVRYIGCSFSIPAQRRLAPKPA